ncbi:MAG: tRNA lysidine(34) synthetase TilS [Proteobacteria bacterium]|nr:tRNA lysidine(34) synthetase TilS [Pseudomonadota bacterium]
MCAASAADDGPIADAEAHALLAPLAAASALVIAVSGGPDSTALMLLAARWRDARATAPRLVAVTIDHGLRAQSAQEAQSVALQARALKIEHRTLCWAGTKPQSGVQEKARAARYALLAQAARDIGAVHVMTAHTREDQAETVLLRLTRGSGLSGLAAMAPLTRCGDFAIVRPLLDVPKARLIATLDAAQVNYIRDPSNEDPRFGRVRARKLMTALAAEGLDATRLGRLAVRLRRADAAIEIAVTQAAARTSHGAWGGHGAIVFDAEGFLGLPAEVAIRLLGRAIAHVGSEGPVELVKLEALFEWLAAAASPARQDGERARRTLAGAIISAADAAISIAMAPPRRPRTAPQSPALRFRQRG